MIENTQEIENAVYFSEKLKSALDLDGDPIAVTITHKNPRRIKKSHRKVTLCMLIQSARRGLSLYCPSDNIICGGKVHVGLGNPPSWDLEEFLVEKEKLVGSKIAARRMLDLARVQSSELGKFIILSPLSQADFHPDVVVFVGTPLTISRILYLDTFKTGEMDTLHREPLCSGVIATPIAQGKIGISFLDMSCRSFGQYKPEEMAIGVPYSRLHNIVDNIGHSIAGTAKSNFILRLLPRIINHRR